MQLIDRASIRQQRENRECCGQQKFLSNFHTTSLVG
jgi:hypothetical protein